ncbi:prolyl-tRNA synthetase associated domain-containing protein [Vibrio sp. SS-MA-C1-2]|uniref:prolyl-tRNA synthetase associated domain-containing protein n=1 Tax=Vibrio sp. SS-MA-C1-2 TaxID=2908646 RepID=UPI001F31278D|nr:prolyl-tRNA synthetase associated domain-containing protein [Vibrio sp. SS-MA-C1-2]UJF18343.1 prolyl-tRNA synthetase associated domain-containing protein [Vibrio sp. SS-MA-C1-2]
MDLYSLFEQFEINYKKFDHPAVYTCDQANELGLDIPGISTKNLFLKDRKGRNHFLVVMSDNKELKLNLLSEQLGVNKLSFASSERLDKYLASKPGSVSILDILSDPNHEVELIIDQDVWNSEQVQCHPKTNTSTLVLSLEDIKKLFNTQNREANVYKL